MNVDVNDKYAIIAALTSYIEYPQDHSVKYGIISSSEFDDIEYGLSPKAAQSLIESLNSDSLIIDDKYVDGVLSTCLSYKAVISDFIRNNPEDLDIPTAKSDRKALNSAIRCLRAYAQENNIALPSSECD